MNKKNEQDEILKQALSLSGVQRAQFVTEINDSDLRNHIENIINDQQIITQHFNQNTANTHTHNSIKSEVLNTGTKINRITIEKLIGIGGMGSVYQGYDEKLKRKVAIKSIRSEYLKVESTHQRFIREAQILSKINHPSICHIYDYIETEDRDYLVLELIQGNLLNQVFLDYDALLKIILQLAKALEAAHKHGIVHRDLKPDNIMITDDYQVKVLDFGIAQSLSNPLKLKDKVKDNKSSDMTKQGSIVGTIRYMSPEQARGETISTASDIYSLGIIVQELFSDENAYAATETNELLESVQNGHTVELTSSFKPIKKIVYKLCQLDPNIRPSATEVCLDIEELILAPKIKKKRIVQFFTLFTFMALIAVLAWQWKQSQFRSKSSELAKSYTNSINQLVRESEQIYVLPLHNTKPEIEQILQKGTKLYIQINNDSHLSEKDKMQLHGLIYLESEDYISAVDLLEKSGADSSLLARARIGLYIDKTSDFALKNGVTKALKNNEIRTNYLTPALVYIDSTAHPDPVHQAFKVSLTESLEAGLFLLNKIIKEKSWDKAAIKLKTQLLLTQADKALEEGDWESAKQFYERTIQTFEQAINMARSYPDSYLGLCKVHNVMLFDGIQRTGQNIDEHAKKAIQACENYLAAYPDDQFAINLLARINIIMAQGQMIYGISPNQSIESAQFWIDKVKDANNPISTMWTRALLHTIKSSYALNNGKLNIEDITQAISLYQKAIIFAPNQVYLRGDLLYAYSLQAEIMDRMGKDISSIIRQAELIFKKSLEIPTILANEKRSLYLNMAAVYYVQLGENYLNNKNILEEGEKLLEFYHLATNELVDEPNLLISIAQVHLLLAQSHIDNHITLTQHITLATDSLHKVQNINPNNPNLLTAQLWLESLKSFVQDNQFSVVEKHFKESSTEFPNNAKIYYLWANHYFLKSQNSSNPSINNSIRESGLLKIRKALIQDPTNKYYLNLEKKLMN